MHRGSCNEVTRAAACDRSTVSLYEINFYVISLVYERNYSVIHVVFFSTQEEDVKNYGKQGSRFKDRKTINFALIERDGCLRR